MNIHAYLALGTAFIGLLITLPIAWGAIKRMKEDEEQGQGNE